MSASKNSLDYADKNVKRASRYVHAVCDYYRWKRIKTDDAIRRAAVDLGISPDLAWRLKYRQKIFSISQDQLDQIQIAHLRSLYQEIAEMEKITENKRAVAKLEEKLVMERMMAKCQDSNCSVSSSVSDAGAGLSLATI